MKKKRARKTMPDRDPVLRREVTAIRRLKKRAASHGKAFLADIIEIGKRLSRNKDRVGHGYWLKWLRKNFKWSGDTAANYINVFELSKAPEFRSLRNLPLEALYLLARRSVSQETRTAVAQRVEAGTQPSLAEIARRTRAKHADPEPAAIQITPSSADNGPRRTFGSVASPPEAASEQHNPITAEVLQAAGREDLVKLIIDIARFRLPRDQSFEEARAVVESIGSEGWLERFSEAVAKLADFVGQLQRALNERRIEEPAPPLHVIPGGKDDPQ